jgi:hypothetical protein
MPKDQQLAYVPGQTKPGVAREDDGGSGRPRATCAHHHLLDRPSTADLPAACGPNGSVPTSTRAQGRVPGGFAGYRHRHRTRALTVG